MSIPIEKFGKDHWSMFAYLETRIVDYKGVLDNRHLRIDRNRHPGNAHQGTNEMKYPTRLRWNAERTLCEHLDDHDDVDCIEDLEAAGLIVETGSGISIMVELTDLGRDVAGQLRGWKGKGGKFIDFAPKVTVS